MLKCCRKRKVSSMVVKLTNFPVSKLPLLENAAVVTSISRNAHSYVCIGSVTAVSSEYPIEYKHDNLKSLDVNIDFVES